MRRSNQEPKMTMRQDLMARLLKGWTTPWNALQDCGCFSLAQRVSEWKWEREMNIVDENGKPPPVIEKKWVKLKNGKTVRAYRAIK
jgi:hypothetical protein